jgi:mRNA interferase RelE/StbE
MTAGHDIVFSRAARRAIEHELPEGVATAALEFILGPLRDHPHGVGRPLREPLAPLWTARRGDYRVICEIRDKQLVIGVISITHRRDAYRR